MTPIHSDSRLQVAVRDQTRVAGSQAPPTAPSALVAPRSWRDFGPSRPVTRNPATHSTRTLAVQSSRTLGGSHEAHATLLLLIALDPVAGPPQLGQPVLTLGDVRGTVI
jgi:hypothetical protein